MKIISDFKEYYDCMLQHGQDDLVYKRLTSEVDLSEENICPPVYPAIYSDSIYEINSLTVGFCGRIFPIVEIVGFRQVGWATSISRSDAWARKRDSTLCMTIQDVDRFVENLSKKSQEVYWSRDFRYFWNRKLYDSPGKRTYFEDFFDKKHNKPTDEQVRTFFAEQQCPVWCSFVSKRNASCTYRRYMTYNPCLSDLEFYRVMDPYQAYQELQMYLGNQAEPRKEMPDIPDSVMAEIKGFDEWSFRRPPGKKKRKKNRK